MRGLVACEIKVEGRRRRRRRSSWVGVTVNEVVVARYEMEWIAYLVVASS
jgi:hypothetical protein